MIFWSAACSNKPRGLTVQLGRSLSTRVVFADMSPLHSLLLLLLFAAVSPQAVVNQTRTEKVLNPEKPEGDDRGEDVGALLRQLKARVEELERKLEAQLEAQLEERGKSCSLTNRGRQQGSGGEEGVWLKTFRCGKNSGLAKKNKKNTDV